VYSFPDISEAVERDRRLDDEDLDKQITDHIVEDDDNVRRDGKLMSDAINNGFSTFTPDMMFDKLQKDFSLAKNSFGERMLRLTTGYNPSFIRKNMKIPEFQRELKERLHKKFEQLEEDGLLKKNGSIAKKGYDLAALVMYTEELDNLATKGFQGEKETKKKLSQGEKKEVRDFRKGDHYKDLDINKTVRKALRRGRKKFETNDLQMSERESRGSVYVIYCFDSSGSMKGKKLEAAKKAGIALAFKVIEKRDKVGFISFSTEIREKVMPTLDFTHLLHKMTAIQGTKETNLTVALDEAMQMFPKGNVTKHVVIFTDALPTIGKDPEKEALQKVSMLRNEGISVSMIGLNLDAKGRAFAEKVTNIAQGKLYVIRDVENLDTIVLEDYYALK
jgi:Mg-chelatase subunit ChlD